MHISIKTQDVFLKEKLINIPSEISKLYLTRYPSLFNIYITQIGYYPAASFYDYEKLEGCEENILIYCVQGKGNYIVDGKHFEVNPNQFFLLPATDKFIRYWADAKDPWTIYWVHFIGTIIENFNDSLNLDVMKGPIKVPSNVKALDIWNDIYQSLEMGFSIENLCNANFCLYHLLAAFLFPKNTHEGIVKNSIIDMKKSLYERLTLEDMAARHQLSVSHFSLLFKKATGVPPGDYFIHLKMQRACELLYADGIKIKDIAHKLGYDDPYYFSRLFKKFIGLSPEQYKTSKNKCIKERETA